jgi:phage terminase large subunit GpA-like protein
MGQVIKNGVKLWPVGTDTAKSTVYARLKVKDPGPGYLHFYIGLTENYFEQLTGEKLIPRYVKGFPVYEWVNVAPGRRNEALDCEVYAYAAAKRAGIDRVNWADLEKAIIGKRRESNQHPAMQKQEPQRSTWLQNTGGWLRR